MKKFLKSVGNFFKKIGLFIWKYLKICWNYIRDNAWIQPIAIVVLIFGLVFGVQGIINGVEKIKENRETKNDEKNNLFIQLSMGEVKEKLASSDNTFTLFIGQTGCFHCDNMKTIVNKYISTTGKDVYYVDINNPDDYTFDRNYFNQWIEMLEDIETRDLISVDPDTGLKSMGTPTFVVVQNGEFADAKSGELEYLNFVDVVSGKYVGKVEPTA